MKRLVYSSLVALLAAVVISCGEGSPLANLTGPGVSPSPTGTQASSGVVIPEGPNSCPDGAYPKGLHANPKGSRSVLVLWLPEDSIEVYDFAFERQVNGETYRHEQQLMTTAVGQQKEFFYFDWTAGGRQEGKYRVRVRTKSRCDTFGPWSPWVTFEVGDDGETADDIPNVVVPPPVIGPLPPVVPPVVPPVPPVPPVVPPVPPVPPPAPGFVLGNNIKAFASLAGSAITCTTSTITGDVGVSPGSSITGIPGLCVLNGSLISTAGSVAAQADLASKYADFDALPCTPIAANLNGVTLTPGVYCSGALASNLSGTLTLNGAGFYLIRFPSTLITSPGSNVSLQGGATCGGVHFQVASSATLAGTLRGNVLAFSSITLNPGATLIGRALARNAAVTLTTATMNSAGCN